MKARTVVLLLVSHAAVALVGFGAGIYVLPILIAPPPPESAQVTAAANRAEYKGEFRRDLKGSDAFHWGEGTVFVGRKTVALKGKVAPGPDYKLYLSPEFVDTKAEFMRVKPRMVRVGDVKTFENFLIYIPESVDPAAFDTVVVWCETFGMFISAARYR